MTFLLLQAKFGGRQPRRPFFLRRNIKKKDKNLDGLSSPPNGLESPVAASKEESRAKEENSGSGTTPPTGAATLTATARNDYQIVDNTEVKLNVNSYKMVWLTNKNGLFYKRNSIAKARTVS